MGIRIPRLVAVSFAVLSLGLISCGGPSDAVETNVFRPGECDGGECDGGGREGADEGEGVIKCKADADCADGTCGRKGICLPKRG